MSKTYSLQYACDNCYSQVTIEIEYGTTANDVAVCTNCGVKAAKKLSKPSPASPKHNPGDIRWTVPDKNLSWVEFV